MKTLAVLTALATIAIAAPTFEGNTDSTSLTQKDLTILQERAKKSILQETLSEKNSEHSEDRATAKTFHKFGPSSSIGKTFTGFKKPIIVKKKIGYHVYRDSDEEQAQADSRESCKQHIKVKLCDDNNSMDKLRSDSIDHSHGEISESEMKDSINMAKAAVETFQKDLQKIQHSSVEDVDHKHLRLDTDKELREDIEKARQALEHIQRKFINFDTVARSKDENISNVVSKTGKSDEERLAEWKEVVSKQKDFEISQNLEDNFKLTDDLKVSSNNNISTELKVALDEDDIKAQINAGDNENTMEDIMTSVSQGKKMEIHSDSLKKSTVENVSQNENKITPIDENVPKIKEVADKGIDSSTELKHSDITDNVECKEHDKVINKHLNEEVLGKKEDFETENKFKSNLVQDQELDMGEKHFENSLDDKLKMKTSIDDSALGVSAHTQLKLDNEVHKGHLHEINENENERQKSEQVDNLSNTIDKTTMHSVETAVLSAEANSHKHENRKNENHDHKNTDQSSNLLTKSSTEPMTVSHNQEQIRNDADNKQQMNLQRSSQKQDQVLVNLEHQKLNSEPSPQGTSGIDKQPERSALSMITSNLGPDQTQFKNHVDEHREKEKLHDDAVQSHVRATSNFNKELLNHMDFDEDSHQTSFNKPSFTKTGHMLKNGNLELHERLNVPRSQVNPEHLETIMHSSDTSQDRTAQRQQLKMGSMFNNEQPNFNAQFNFPQTFEEQTNVQKIRPFKEAVDVHDRHTHRSDSINQKDQTSGVLHDPLKVRWAHEDHLHLDNLKGASQFDNDNMEMGGSSQHFTVDKSMPISSLDGQHMDFDGIKAQQRWLQENNMNARKSMALNSGLALHNLQRNDNLQNSFQMGKTMNNFEQLHDHSNFVSRNTGHNTIMHGKSNVDAAMQPSSFMHMRDTPKMAFDHTDHNRWAHNHGAFRSSYGPSMSASYGSGGAPSSGGSAVGLFPNANVGNCAVPLLLSCSPSVVSGSLAKANTYSAPSYRSEDINFLRKRDTDTGDANSGVDVHGHTLLSHQPRTILEKKRT